MTKENIEFLGELLKRITGTYNMGLITSNVSLEFHSGKDYWTIDCSFKYCNSEYKDCVVFYTDKDHFEPASILEDFDTIVVKAKQILKR